MQVLSTPSGLDNPFKSCGLIRSAVTLLYKWCYMSHFPAQSIIEDVIDAKTVSVVFKGGTFRQLLLCLQYVLISLEVLEITQWLMFLDCVKCENNQCL